MPLQYRTAVLTCVLGVAAVIRVCEWLITLWAFQHSYFTVPCDRSVLATKADGNYDWDEINPVLYVLPRTIAFSAERTSASWLTKTSASS